MLDAYKELTPVIYGENAGSKLSKAAELGVATMSEEHFLEEVRKLEQDH